MNRFVVKYLDSKRGDTLMVWEGEAEDESDALDQAMEDDYYFGQLVSIEDEGER